MVRLSVRALSIVSAVMQPLRETIAITSATLLATLFNQWYSDAAVITRHPAIPRGSNSIDTSLPAIDYFDALGGHHWGMFLIALDGAGRAGTLAAVGQVWVCSEHGGCIGAAFKLLNRVRRQASSPHRLMNRAQKVVVVMQAYNAARTLRQTYAEVQEQQLVDRIILVDDGSRDDTVAVARSLEGVQVHVHEVNKGYGGNQKTCYRLALEAGADIVIMIHPDYQYTPKLIPAMVSIIGNGLHPCVLGSRILGGYALRGGMPLWRYVSNRCLTLAENILLGAKLSEYHTGYRAFSREILQ